MVEAAASLTSVDFEYIRTLVQRLAAMELEEDKQYLVQARLAPVATNAGCRDLAELARRVRLEESGALTGKIIDALTTNETLFATATPLTPYGRRFFPQSSRQEKIRASCPCGPRHHPPDRKRIASPCW